MKLKIAILGTRGIPNHYGGYEQAVSFLAPALVKKGHHVTVYNSHNHPYQQEEYKGVKIVHCNDPENKLGTAGQFIYDLNCIRDARRREYDVLLLMGYTSSSVWGKLYPKKSVIISNMDGLEWTRSKYAKPVRRFLHYAEKLAVKHSDFYIADSPGIQSYLKKSYQIESAYIPYGAVIYQRKDEGVLKEYNIQPGQYYLLISRMEPENNIETILDGYCKSDSVLKFLVVGNTGNKHGQYLVKKFSHNNNIIFAGAIFDQKKLHNLKAFCKLYFHGHSVGGTNPSLLEAMASCATIAAHNNPFNKAVLGADSVYFTNPEDVSTIINAPAAFKNPGMVCNNLKKIQEQYSWELITEQYETFIIDCWNRKRNEEPGFNKRQPGNQDQLLPAGRPSHCASI
jgi:glycosyltransferase involved in cell wall biosynthesis